MERSARIWFSCVVAVLACAVWWCEVFPSQDGPAHVYNSALLRTMLADARSPLHGVYELHTDLTTNWTAHLLLMPLLSVMSPESADKLLVILALLVSAAGMALCLRGAEWLLPFTLPLFVNGLLFSGFYSFMFGAGLMLLVLGGARPRWLWLALCWLSHPFCWAGAVLGSLATDRQRWRRLALEASPGAICAIWFVVKGGGSLIAPPLFAGRWREFVFGENAFAVVHEAYAAASFLLLGTICWMAGFALRRGGVEKTLAALAAGWWLIWPLAPNQTMTGNLVPRRVMLFALIFTLLWVAKQEWDRKWQQRALNAGILVATLLIGVVVWRVLAIQPLLAEYRTMRPEGTTLSLRHSLESGGPEVIRGVDAFLHAGDWLMVRHGAASVDNYEAWTAHFPLRYKRPLMKGLVNTSGAPPVVQLKDQSLPDTVILWGYPSGDGFRRELEKHYKLAQRTAPRGAGEVWKRLRSPTAQ